MSEDVKLYGEARNFAIVQLPGRRFPGVVVQGDSLNEIFRQLSESVDLIARGEKEGIEIISALRDQISEVLSYYRRTCLREGVDIPFK